MRFILAAFAAFFLGFCTRASGEGELYGVQAVMVLKRIAGTTLTKIDRMQEEGSHLSGDRASLT